MATCEPPIPHGFRGPIAWSCTPPLPAGRSTSRSDSCLLTRCAGLPAQKHGIITTRNDHSSLIQVLEIDSAELLRGHSLAGLERLIGRPRPGVPKICPRSQTHSPREKVMTGTPRIACPS
jgi:hypothetical protein